MSLTTVPGCSEAPNCLLWTPFNVGLLKFCFHSILLHLWATVVFRVTICLDISILSSCSAFVILPAVRNNVIAIGPLDPELNLVHILVSEIHGVRRCSFRIWLGSAQLPAASPRRHKGGPTTFTPFPGWVQNHPSICKYIASCTIFEQLNHFSVISYFTTLCVSCQNTAHLPAARGQPFSSSAGCV